VAVERAFQVDLRGVVDLLSHHLYTSPRVYLRELLQNAADAITARRVLDPGAPALVSIEPPELTGDGTLRMLDTGIGLTEAEVHELLATIGRSSKRDDLGLARHEFLGQFGIGLLSCFMVASEVRVLTRSARGGPTVLWIGHADGRYQVLPAPEERPERGTTVSLVPRPGLEQWLEAETVISLASLFGDLLGVHVAVGERQVNSGALPWRRDYRSADARTAALNEYAQRLFGFVPFEIIDLAVPEAGLTGVAFVLPTAAKPAAQGGHRVYLRRMLLTEAVDRLLPDWTFFVRCVVDTGELRPTASREGLYEDDLLAATRDALGVQLKDWLVRLAATAPDRLLRFLAVHHLGVKAIAQHDLEMLRIVDYWWPMETSAGPMTLAAFRRQFPVVRYTLSSDEFRALAGVASAQGIGVINGGYAYDIEIMKRLPHLDPAVRVQALDPADLATRFEPPDPAAAAAMRPVLAAAAAALDPVDCDVTMRAFDPPALPALYLVNRAAISAQEMRQARAGAEGIWSDVLASLDTGSAAPGSTASAAPGGTAPGSTGPMASGQLAPPRPQLVLNLRNPVVRRIADLGDPSLAGLGVQALYGQALLQGHHPMRPDDTVLLNRSLLGLLDWATSPGTTSPGTASPGPAS
jgi:molecular chaperone HtpG